MSAKHSKKGAKPTPATPAPAAARPASAPASTTAALGHQAAPAVAVSDTAATAPSWLDSTDPRKRTFGKLLLAGVWLYVGALWLLAIDQLFNLGIFGPKLPPMP